MDITANDVEIERISQDRLQQLQTYVQTIVCKRKSFDFLLQSSWNEVKTSNVVFMFSL